VLHRAGGVYQVGAFAIAGQNAKIDYASNTQIRIAGAFSLSQNVSVTPAKGSGLTAGALVVEALAANGANGTVPAAAFQNAQIQGLVVAPNGRIVVAQNAAVLGAFAAQDVEIQQNGVVTWQDGFSSSGSCGSCDDQNPCTLDGCVSGTCTHSPMANGTTCSDGNSCTNGDACQSGSCVAGAK